MNDLDSAIDLLKRNEVEKAENLLSQLIDRDPYNFDANHMLGVIYGKQKKFATAEKLFRTSLSIDPNYPPLYQNYGMLLNDMKRFEEAIEQFNCAIRLAPDFAPCYSNRGNALRELGKLDEALSDQDHAIRLAPNFFGFYYNRGSVLRKKKKYDEALADFDRAVALNANFADAHCGRGNVFYDLKRHDEAIAAYDKALAIRPDLEVAWLGRANVFHDLKRHTDAFAAYDKALTINPDLENAWLGRGNILWNLRRYDEAIAAYDRALVIKPDLQAAWSGRGNVFFDLDRYDEAIAAYDRALAIDPDLEDAWLGRGNVFFTLNRDADALACFDKALDLNYDFAEAWFHKALLKLSLGEYEEGWRLYEWRWKTRGFTSPNRNFPAPLWLNDKDITGKTILIHAEQGLGDTIQFSRYLGLLNDKNVKVIFEVQKQLETLFQSQNLQCEIIALGTRLPSFDVHCPLLSLPLAFKTTVDTIPRSIPYIRSGDAKTREWAERIGGRTKPRIGVAWSGNPQFARGNDISRPIPLSNLSSIMSDNFDWYRLQKDVRANDIEALEALPFIKDFAHLFNDFSDTAALIAQLDLVISIDTSIAHLAGAMGKPTWILLPFHADFRWLHSRIDSPWYPTARLYRQTQDHSWTDVLERVSADLAALMADRS